MSRQQQPQSKKKKPVVRIGCAGWTLPAHSADQFPADGTHLQRYSNRLNAAEINSSFHRPHSAATYAKWAASVPLGFRFAVKMPKEISHVQRLRESEHLLDRFFGQVSGLKKKLGPLLLQLPPSLAFDAEVAKAFFAALRQRFDGQIVCEPRHESWLSVPAENLMVEEKISRAAADPAKFPGAEEPGGCREIAYFRLHGSPVIYRSEYSDDHLQSVGEKLRALGRADIQSWCIFDNTVQGFATRNALSLREHLSSESN